MLDNFVAKEMTEDKSAPRAILYTCNSYGLVHEYETWQGVCWVQMLELVVDENQARITARCFFRDIFVASKLRPPGRVSQLQARPTSRSSSRHKNNYHSMALPLQAGLTPMEVAFLCEMEMITVIPRQRLESLNLLSVSPDPASPSNGFMLSQLIFRASTPYLPIVYDCPSTASKLTQTRVPPPF